MSLFSGFSRSATAFSGSFAKAAFVGANTVNGPGPISVSTRPAALTAETSVVRLGAFEAFSTTLFVGNISTPPTIVLSA